MFEVTFVIRPTTKPATTEPASCTSLWLGKRRITALQPEDIFRSRIANRRYLQRSSEYGCKNAVANRYTKPADEDALILLLRILVVLCLLQHQRTDCGVDKHRKSCNNQLTKTFTAVDPSAVTPILDGGSSVRVSSSEYA
jgi:hypothetical protein